MARGNDTRFHRNRQVTREGNVFRVNFDPRQNHPSMQGRAPKVTHTQDTDEASPHGMPRPKL